VSNKDPVDRTLDAAADATLVASRALLGVIARSLVGVLNHVTLPQFRVLVILASSGPLRMGVIAARMGTHPSTLSRIVDRLVIGELVVRQRNADSRREMLIALSAAGRELVDRVTAQRRNEIRRVLAGLSSDEREQIEAALSLFARAAAGAEPSELLVLGL
jgi:DNA-binding MarR family transcriptional regulator